MSFSLHINHLAKALAGEDPMQAIASLFAQYWARTDQGILISYGPERAGIRQKN